jgi:hypothetical protein
MHEERARRRLEWGCGCFALAVALIVTAPTTLMGLAVFLDSQRQVLSRVPSPDGRRVAQVERLVVGGQPHIVITLRRSWQPDWYLTSCKAVSHYGDMPARLRWSGDRVLVVDALPLQWHSLAPFRWDGPLKGPQGCPPVAVLTPVANSS